MGIGQKCPLYRDVPPRVILWDELMSNLKEAALGWLETSQELAEKDGEKIVEIAL